MGCNCQRTRIHCVTQSSPSTMLSFVEKAPKYSSVSLIPVAESDRRRSSNQPAASDALHDVHISAQLMEDFLELARENTDKDLETCGILGAFFERGTYYVTTLIVPKQESSSNSCEAVKEEEYFAIQRERSLFPVGWIHTHPSQQCFLSSVDLHTQYTYQLGWFSVELGHADVIISICFQVMVPEALAIVMAPTDTTRSYGIFRVSSPGGMNVLSQCQERGFHPHADPADGSPIYEHCSNVYINSNLRFEVFDLRQ